MYEQFGSHQVGKDESSGKVEFKLYFPSSNKYVKGGNPNIESIYIIGDFQSKIGKKDWDIKSAPEMKETHMDDGSSVWTYTSPKELPSGFYQYKYYVSFNDGSTSRIISDPCSRYGGKNNQNSAFVIGGSHPEVKPIKGKRKHLRDLVIYELMIDDFTDEFREDRAPLDAIQDKLDYLQELGINAILFMPWTSWGGKKFSWGYDPFQYFSVEYKYANVLNKPEEKLSWLKLLINNCHKRGIHVIMDGVFNHVGSLYEFPYAALYEERSNCPYIGKFGGEFDGLQDLNFNNQCTREFIRDVCFYWIDEFKIDGIRFDNAVNYYIPDNTQGMPELLNDIQEHVKGQKNFSLTLEYLDSSASQVVNLTKATSYWNNALHQCCFKYLLNNKIDSEIMNALDNHEGLVDNKVATVYIGNHDHSHVSWQAGAKNNIGSMEWYRTQPYLIALFTSPGVPLIQNGQEFAEDYWIPEDEKGSNRRVQPRPLHWNFSNDIIGSKLIKIYQKLIKIRHEYSALRSNNFYPANWEIWQTTFNSRGYGVDVENGILIYHRWGNNKDGKFQYFIIVINFSDVEVKNLNVPFTENGVWEDLLNDSTENVSDYSKKIDVSSNWGKIFFKTAD